MPVFATFFLCLALFLTGCSSVLPPIQSMSDARQAVQAAQAVRAQHYMPATMAYSERRLQQAEAELAKGTHAYLFAHFNALVAKDEAVYAYQIATYLNNAEQLLQKAAQRGFHWQALEADLTKAKTAARLGNLDRALHLARYTEWRAQQTAQQAYLEQAQNWLQQCESRTELSAAQQHFDRLSAPQRLQQAREAINQNQGEQALEYLRPLMETVP